MGENQTTSPGLITSIDPPSRWTHPQPAVTISVWPSGWVCHAVRAPGSNVKVPQDLTGHNCINLRLPTHGGLYAWEFAMDGRELRVRVEGQMVFNETPPMLDAALAGLGLAYLPEEGVRTYLDDGRLIRVLADWCPAYPGYHLYYPTRRQPTPAFALLVDVLRYRG